MDKINIKIVPKAACRPKPQPRRLIIVAAAILILFGLAHLPSLVSRPSFAEMGMNIGTPKTGSSTYDNSTPSDKTSLDQSKPISDGEQTPPKFDDKSASPNMAWPPGCLNIKDPYRQGYSWIEFVRKVYAGEICLIRWQAAGFVIESKTCCCQFHNTNMYSRVSAGCPYPGDAECLAAIAAEKARLEQAWADAYNAWRDQSLQYCEGWAKQECQKDGEEGNRCPGKSYERWLAQCQYLPGGPAEKKCVKMPALFGFGGGEYCYWTGSCPDKSHDAVILLAFSAPVVGYPAGGLHFCPGNLKMFVSNGLASFDCTKGGGGGGSGGGSGGGGTGGGGGGGSGGGSGGGGTGGGSGAGGGGGTGGTGGGGTGGSGGSGGEGGTGGGEGTGDDPTPKLIAPVDGFVYEGGELSFEWGMAKDRTIDKSWLNFMLNGWNAEWDAEHWPQGKKEMGSATTFTISEEEIIKMLLAQKRLQPGQDIVWSWKVIVQYKDDINLYISEVWNIKVDTTKLVALNAPILISPEDEFLVDMSESDQITFSWKPGLAGEPDKYFLQLTSLVENGDLQKVKDMGTKTEYTVSLKGFYTDLTGWRPTVDTDVEWRVVAKINGELYFSEARVLYLPILTPQLKQPVNNFVWGGNSGITLKWEPGEGSQPESYFLFINGSGSDQKNIYDVGTDTFADMSKNFLDDKVANDWGPYLEWYVVANYYDKTLRIESEHRRIRISS